MPDVIIAVVPAVGHESLVADGPRVPGCEPERPMLLRRTIAPLGTLLLLDSEGNVVTP